MRKCFLFLIFFFLFVFPFQLLAKEEKVVINEIAWMGSFKNPFFEWIELYNPTSKEIDLDGWTLMADDGSPKIEIKKEKAKTTKIPPFGFYLLKREGDFLKEKADFVYKGALENSGENLRLFDKEGREVDAVLAEFSWFGGDNKEKKTMERIDPLKSGSNKDNWKTSKIENGTPKQRNSVFGKRTEKIEAEAGEDIISTVGKEILFDASFSKGEIEKYIWNFGDGNQAFGKKVTHIYQFPGEYISVLKVIGKDGKESYDSKRLIIYPDSILISEIFPNPKGKDEGREWIEIANKSEWVVDLSFWGISSRKDKIEFFFPENTFLLPCQFLVLPSFLTKIHLSNEKDSLFLFYPDGSLAQEIHFKEVKEGWSIAEREGEYFYTNIPTPGKKNIFSNFFSSSFSSQKISSPLSFNDLKKKAISFLKTKTFAPKDRLIFSLFFVTLFAGFSGICLLKFKEKSKIVK